MDLIQKLANSKLGKGLITLSIPYILLNPLTSLGQEISKTEKDEYDNDSYRISELLNKYDENKDGQISEDEYFKIRGDEIVKYNRISEHNTQEKEKILPSIFDSNSKEIVKKFVEKTFYSMVEEIKLENKMGREFIGIDINEDKIIDKSDDLNKDGLIGYGDIATKITRKYFPKNK